LQQLRDSGSYPIGVAEAPLKIDLNIATYDPAQLLETLLERCGAELSLRIVLRVEHQHADPPHPLRLLGVQSQRPRGCYRAKRVNKFSSPDLRRHAVAPATVAEVYG
jgi:hypothetical protein